jgi:hypothetical protein
VIRPCNVCLVTRGAPPVIRVGLLDAKHGSDELNALLTGDEASRAKATKPKRAGASKLSTAQKLQERDRMIAELENKIREQDGVIREKERVIREKEGQIQALDPFSDMERVAAQQRAQDFVDALMDDNAYLPVIGGINMTYLPGLPSLETGWKSPLIVRSITGAFWDACVAINDSPDKSCRVTAIGTPGIGKTTSTPLLIRKLLKEGKTVVYHVRNEEKDGWIYEFVPKGDTYQARVFPEERGRKYIPSLRLKSTYYIVDPGFTKDNCNPGAMFQPKVVIVSSPDDRHWGGSSFTKGLAGITGLFLYYPVWSKEEIQAVKYILQPDMDDPSLKERYRLFGGVPRNVFSTDNALVLLKLQDEAVAALTSTQAQRIAEGRMAVVGTFGKTQPRSSVLAYDLAPNDNGTFTEYRTILVSSAVKDKVYSTHAGALWTFMMQQEDASVRGYFLQAYVRYLLTRKVLGFQRRKGVGMLHPDRNKTHPITLPSCSEIAFVEDPALSLADPESKPFVLYHSSNSNYELIDCLYKDNYDNVYAIQTTLKQKGHSANPKQMEKLQAKLRNYKNIALYYMVPSEIFSGFVTSPVDPQNSTKVTLNVFHAAIPNPAMEFVAGP